MSAPKRIRTWRTTLFLRRRCVAAGRATRAHAVWAADRAFGPTSCTATSRRASPPGTPPHHAGENGIRGRPAKCCSRTFPRVAA